MIGRCYQPAVNSYKDYGGRGIAVFKGWINSYESFLAYIGRAPSPKHSIERINVNGNYEPGNVKWATAKEQGRNMRSNRILTANGKTMILSEWAAYLKIGVGALHGRIRRKKYPLHVLLDPEFAKNYKRSALVSKADKETPPVTGAVPLA